MSRARAKGGGVHPVTTLPWISNYFLIISRAGEDRNSLQTGGHSAHRLFLFVKYLLAVGSILRRNAFLDEGRVRLAKNLKNLRF